MLNVIPIPAFKDNYIWLLVNPNNHCAAVVDPGESDQVLRHLTLNKLRLTAILITHHHYDHTGGLETLLNHFSVPVYGPKNDNVPGVDHKLIENDQVLLSDLHLKLRVIDIPGHTKGHIAFYGNKMLFCGDTLFAAGCGRIFEGTPKQMFESLAKMASLPDDTLIYCAHEYTETNLRFATQVEPHNMDIQKRIKEVTALRASHTPTLPSTLHLEKLTNPFLRSNQESVIKSIQEHTGQMITDPVSIFQLTRQWKDTW